MATVPPHFSNPLADSKAFASPSPSMHRGALFNSDPLGAWCMVRAVDPSGSRLFKNKVNDIVMTTFEFDT